MRLKDVADSAPCVLRFGEERVHGWMDGWMDGCWIFFNNVLRRWYEVRKSKLQPNVSTTTSYTPTHPLDTPTSTFRHYPRVSG